MTSTLFGLPTEVVSAAAAVLSALFVLTGGVVAGLALRTSRRQLNLLQEDQRREQAKLFAVWCLPTADGLLVMYHNAGAMPVFDVKIVVSIDGVVSEPVAGRIIEPTDRPAADQQWSLVADALANRAIVERNPSTKGIVDDVLQLRTTGQAAVTVTFRDAAGRVWQRAADGQLVRGGASGVAAPGQTKE